MDDDEDNAYMTETETKKEFDEPSKKRKREFGCAYGNRISVT
jgi:hypothetical protein